MKLRPIKKSILFQFTDKTGSKSFDNSTRGGIVLPGGIGGQTDIMRWGKVLSCGDAVIGIAPDDYILIEPGKWTTGLTCGDTTIWKTEEKFIVAISDVEHQYEL